MGVKLSF